MAGTVDNLYDPETGLVRNRNDNRFALAARLMDPIQTGPIPGAGPTNATIAANLLRGLAAWKLTSDARADGQAEGQRQEAEASRFFANIPGFGNMGQSGPKFGDAAAPAAPTPDAPAMPQATPQQPAPGGTGGGYADRVIGVESNGNPTATNPRSSATGAGQFISGTWLDLMRRTRPDLANGRSDADLLAMRTDPALSRSMVETYARENGQALQSAGLPVNDGTLYTAHAFGPQGATALLQAPPNTPAASVLGDRVIAANPHLRGMTAGQVAQMYSTRGGGGGGGAPAPQQPAPDAGGLSTPTAAPMSPGEQRAAAVTAGMPQQQTDPKMAALARRLSPETVAQLEQAATMAAFSRNPNINRGASMLQARAQQAAAMLARQDEQERRGQDRQDNLNFRRDQLAAQDRDRAERLANRNVQTAQIQDPDGKVGLYQVNPDGTLGRRLGDAAGQPRTPATPSAFGNSADGHALDVINQFGQGYRNGTLTPEQRQLYETAATHYTQPRTQQTPSGLVQMTPQLPPGMPQAGQFGPQAPAGGPGAPAGGGNGGPAPGGAPGTTGGAPGQGQPSQLPGTTPLPGVRVLPNDQREPPEKFATSMLVNMDSARRVQTAMAALSGNPDAVGPGRQFFPSLTNWFDPSGTTTRAMVADIGSLKLHDRSGAAITASEEPRLLPFVPTIGDTRQVAMDKMRKFLNEYVNVVRDHNEAYGPASGYRALPPVDRFLRQFPADAQAGGTPAPGAPGLAPAPPQAAPPVPAGQGQAPGGAGPPPPPPGFQIIGRSASGGY